MTVKEEIQFFISYLYLKHPFYNSIISNFELKLQSNDKSKEFKIYIENKTHLIIDTEFAEKSIKKDKKLFFYYIIHEILHVILLHKKRETLKDSRKWDVATDLAIEQIILEDRILSSLVSLPTSKGNVVYVREKKGKVPNAETIYTKISLKEDEDETGKEKEEENNPDNPEADYNLDNHSTWNEEDISEEDMQDMLVKAYQFTKSHTNEKEAGGIPGVFSEIIDSILKPKTNLNYFLNKIIQNFKKTSHSYKRGDRRYLYNNLIVPSRIKNVKHFKLLFYIDTSGSMDIEGLKQSISEIVYLTRSLDSFEFTIIQSDCSINNEIVITDKNVQDFNKLFEIKGRGGTEFKPLFDLLKEDNGKQFDAIVTNSDFFITDEEFQEYLVLEKKYKFLTLIPKEHNEVNIKQIDNVFYL
jgi:predicted metal-dependent peptidase